MKAIDLLFKARHATDNGDIFIFTFDELGTYVSTFNNVVMESVNNKTKNDGANTQTKVSI